MQTTTILEQSPYNEVWARINRIVKKTKDKYRGKSYFPIGTFRPIQEYNPDEDIPENEIYFFKLDTTASNNASSIIMIGQSGTQKTTLIKTIVYYNSLLPNTKIGIMDLKGISKDWDKCNYQHQNKGMLYNEPATMKIEAGVPLFATRGMPQEEKRRTKILNLNPKELADQNILVGLGFSPIARQHLYRLLQDGTKPTDLLKEVEELYRRRRMTKPSYDNIMLLMDNMLRAGFISDKNHFDLNKVWDEGKAWALGFNNKEIPFLSVYVDKIMTNVFDRANSSKGRNERYLLVVDDCQKAFGLDPMKYPSVQTGIDSLTQWRFLGINIILGVQCILPNNFIRLTDGRLRTVEELYEMQEELKINNCKSSELEKYSNRDKRGIRTESLKPLITNIITKSNIYAITKKTGKRKKYTITTRGGYRIEITDKHKLYVNISKTTGYRPLIKCLPIEEIKVGHYLISNNFEDIDYDDNINVDMLIEDNKYYKKINNGYNLFKEGKHTTDKGIKIVDKMTPELSRLMAYIISDGCIVPKKQTILFNNSFQNIIDDYIYCFKKVFGLEPNKIKKEKDKNTIRVIYYSASVIDFFNQLGLEGIGLAKKVPDCIMKASIDNKKSFVRAYFDCDGSLSKRDLSVTSICKKTIQSIHCILKEFNIGSTITILKHTTGFRSNNMLYHLRVSNKEDYMKLISSLRFKYDNNYNERNLIGDIKFFVIKSIEVEDYDGDYYNISVKDNENYFTGTMGSLLSKNSPTMLDDEIYSDIKHFFVYRTGNAGHLSKYIPNRNIIDSIKQLRFQPEKFISECVHIHPDRSRYTRFFPFNSSLANIILLFSVINIFSGLIIWI